jgi:hypothetical protein
LARADAREVAERSLRHKFGLFSSELSTAIGAPVIDGVTAAVKLVEALAGLGLQTAKRGEYAPPLEKQYAGLFASFSPPAATTVRTR